MNKFDKQRIENALWTLLQYDDELRDVLEDVFADDKWTYARDAIEVMEQTLYKLQNEE